MSQQNGSSFFNETLPELRHNPVYFASCILFYFAILVFGNGMLYAIVYYKNYTKNPMKSNLVDRLIVVVCSAFIANNIINVHITMHFLIIGSLGKTISN